MTNNWSSHPFDGYHIQYTGNSCMLRLDSLDGGPSPEWLPFDYATNLPRRVVGPGRGNYSGQYHPDVGLIDASANELNSSTTPVPCAIYAFGAQQRSRYVGEVPDFGLCNMAFLAPGDPLVVGSDTWRVYPLLQRGNRHRLRPHQRMGRLLLSDGRVMATFPGFQVPKPVEGIVAGITPNIDALELNQDISLAAVAASTWAGAYAAHQPVEVIHSSYQAVHQSALEENYYNRLWLIPTTMELGNVVSTQVRPASVWNAYFSPRTLTAINREAADGITLSGQASPPLGFAALEERTWTVSIGTDGPPVVNARIVWRLQGEPDLVLVITGNRIIAWTFAPDWGDSIVERLSASTNILQSESAVTQRRAMRLAPRREFEANMYAVDRERQLLDMTLFGWGARIWALPIWPDIQLLQQPLAAGSLSIPCDTVGLDFRDGGLAMLRGEDAFNYEVVEVKAVTAAGLDLVRPVQATWVTGSRLYPVRTAQLTEQPTLTRLTDTAQSARVSFLVMEPSAWPELMPATTYRDRPVLEQRPDESEDLASSYQRLLSTLDNGSAIPRVTDVAGMALPVLGHRWIGMGRAERSAFRSLVYALRGQQKPLWVPTHADDLTLVATVSQLSTALDVRNIGYARFANGRPGRRDIRIELYDGTVYHRRILTSTELDANTERLAIDAALGRLVEPGDVARICFMALCSAATDVVEIEHVTDSEGVATAALTFKGVRDDEF
nr:hypothetical protein [Pseudomonas aeruginosa]